jgi:hypothetical protein
MKKLLLVLIVVGLLAVWIVPRWDDVKLSLTRLWGYRTITNNPLLPFLDTDIGASDTIPRIDLDELFAGGPPKDGIPAIDRPRFTTVGGTEFSEGEVGLGLTINGEAKFYPYGILNWHEIVNDTVGGVPVSVTLCPLCDTGMTFERIVDGQETTFGVSGKLYQSCLVMYDRLTDTLWSQPWGLGIVGQQVNGSLNRYPTVKTTLGQWAEVHPDTMVLSPDTGHSRDYFRYPYGSYMTNETIIFPVRNQEKIVGHPKDIETYYIDASERSPTSKFAGVAIRFRNESVKNLGSIIERRDGREFRAEWDEELHVVRVFEGERELATTTSFGFVYPAFFLP